jgi:hypothetical protein
MKICLRNRNVVPAIALTAALWLGASGAAAQESQQKMPSSAAPVGIGGDPYGDTMSWSDAARLIKISPTPRMPDGHPDLSGVWFSGVVPDVGHIHYYAPASRTFDQKLTPQEKPAFRRWVAEKVKRMGPSLVPLTPDLSCLPRGALSYTLQEEEYPMQLVQNPQALVELTESDTTYRFMPTDGRMHDEDAGPEFNGDSIGHWEGDTLVVDVTSIDPRVWLAGAPAWFPSDEAHYVERYSRPDLNTLIYQVTIDDPKVLKKPWVSVPRRFTWAGPGKRLYERFCTNEQDYEQLDGPAARKLTAAGNDERFFDEEEYEELSKQYPDN